MSPGTPDWAALIRLRLASAEEALRDAGILRQSGSLRGATNRVYYAMFYAASALALHEGQSFRKHAGLIAYIHKEWVATGRLEKQHGRALQRAFENRSEGDYQDILRSTAEDIDQGLADVIAFLQAVRKRVAKPADPEHP